MAEDFEIVKGNRGNGVAKAVGDVVSNLSDESKQELVHAAAENFGEIVKIAGDIVQIRKIYADSDAKVAEIEAKKGVLIAEADNYVKRVEADTHQTLSKAEQVRLLLNDFYKNNPGNLSGEEFAGIIKELIK